jgi:hypothetical protein
MAVPTVDVPQPPWTYDLEIALFRAIVSYRPIGLHKSFHLISILNALNSQIPTSDPPLTLPDIKAKLDSLYNMDGIEEAEESDESATEEVTSLTSLPALDWKRKTDLEVPIPVPGGFGNGGRSREGSRGRSISAKFS